MSAKDVFKTNLQSLIHILGLVREEDVFLLGLEAETLASKLAGGNSVFWCGNGGSAAESQHMAAELMGRFKLNRPAMSSIALTTDSSVLTSIGNDFEFADVFKRQVEGLAKSGDTLVVYTTSGNSENIIRALTVAKAKNVRTIAFLAGDGGKAAQLADYSFVVPTEDTPRAQEVHTLMGHSFCEVVERRFSELTDV